jgi:hypothetical protein
MEGLRNVSDQNFMALYNLQLVKDSLYSHLLPATGGLHALPQLSDEDMVLADLPLNPELGTQVGRNAPVLRLSGWPLLAAQKGHLVLGGLS